VAIEGGGMMGVPAWRPHLHRTVGGRPFRDDDQPGLERGRICFVIPDAEAKHAVAALENALRWSGRMKLIDRIDAETKIALIGRRQASAWPAAPALRARTFSAWPCERS